MQTLPQLLPDAGFANALDTIVRPFLAPMRTDYHFKGHDGALLHGRIYTNAHASATIVLCHGLSEYAEKYLESIDMFVKLGFSVAICEHRGHGFSARMTDSPYKIHVDTFDTYVRDFECFTTLVQKKCPNQPLYLLGHSMGGCIAARYLVNYPNRYKAAILVSPMLGLAPQGIPASLAALYCKFLLLRGKGAETLTPPHFDPGEDFATSSYTNRDRFDTFVAQRIAEPHYQTSQATINWLATSLRAIRTVQRTAQQITIPVLLFQAGRDHLVLPSGHQQFMKKVPQTQFVQLSEAKHDIANSNLQTRKTYWQTIADFLQFV